VCRLTPRTPGAGASLGAGVLGALRRRAGADAREVGDEPARRAGAVAGTVGGGAGRP
jgi:hypothetical protein